MPRLLAEIGIVADDRSRGIRSCRIYEVSKLEARQISSLTILDIAYGCTHVCK
jgi:hypothetical protein